jgi:hypothetical protein
MGGALPLDGPMLTLTWGLGATIWSGDVISYLRALHGLLAGIFAGGGQG